MRAARGAVLRRLSVRTAGESHGRGVFAMVGGFPAGVPFDAAFIDAWLARRQSGFGRSSRQQLEHDRVEALAGIVRGKTTGAPLLLAVWNRDDSLATKPALLRPRPGHGDLAGGQKYGLRDMRPVLERASARETAARVAAGALAAALLARLGIETLAHVLELGGVAGTPERKALTARELPALRLQRDASAFHALDPRLEARFRRAVLAARHEGDTLGGRFEVLAFGVPAGLGSLEDFGSRMDTRLGAALLSIPAIKAVELGDGVTNAALRGSRVHDAVGRPGAHGPTRRSNRAGGLEAGMTNGEVLVARAWMKPIPTLARPLASWDYERNAASPAFFERSDVTSVPAASVVGEAMVALVVLDALLEKSGGDTLAEVRRALGGQRRDIARRFGSPAKRTPRR